MVPTCCATVAAGETCEVQLTVLVDGGPNGPAAGLQGVGAGASPLDSNVILRIEYSGYKFVTILGELTGALYCRAVYDVQIKWLTAFMPAWVQTASVSLAAHRVARCAIPRGM